MRSILRRFVSLRFKENILNSWFYRIYLRINLHRKKIRFSVEITTKCNIDCAMCTRMDMIKKNKLVVRDMDLRIIDKTIEEMKKFVIHGYEVTFAPMGLGEPLLCSNLEEIISKVKRASKKIKISLVTNGVCLTREKIERLLKLGVDEISVSLNTNNAVEYKKYMKFDNYQKIKKNVENLIKIRNKSGLTIPSIYVQYLNYKNKKNAFNKDLEYWRKIMKFGDKCYVHPIVNQGGFKKNKLSSFRDGNFPCSNPLLRVAIRVNGDMYPCDSCFYAGNQKIEELYLGNVLKNSFWKIFSNKKSKNFKIVEDMKKGDYSKLLVCKKCDTYKLSGNCFFKNPITKRWM